MTEAQQDAIKKLAMAGDDLALARRIALDLNRIADALESIARSTERQLPRWI